MNGSPGFRRAAVALAVVLGCIVFAGCRGDGEAPTSTPAPIATATAATATATATATPTPSLEDEVTEAYLAYWDAYAEALLVLDASLVESVTAGEELERVREEVEGLRADGVAARVVVEHDFSVVYVTNERAVVLDRFVDRSFFVDPSTLEPETSDVPGQAVRDTFNLLRTERGWVVISSARER